MNYITFLTSVFPDLQSKYVSLKNALISLASALLNQSELLKKGGLGVGEGRGGWAALLIDVRVKSVRLEAATS